VRGPVDMSVEIPAIRILSDAELEARKDVVYTEEGKEVVIDCIVLFLIVFGILLFWIVLDCLINFDCN
jgi:hypothetical protein